MNGGREDAALVRFTEERRVELTAEIDGLRREAGFAPSDDHLLLEHEQLEARAWHGYGHDHVVERCWSCGAWPTPFALGCCSYCHAVERDLTQELVQAGVPLTAPV
jgi:hypothetical protein